MIVPKMGNAKSRRKASIARREQILAKEPESLHEQKRPPRFVADVMLGKLAKWLRIAGFDVLYSNAFTDDEIIALSRDEGRVLLSLDSRLLVRKSVKRFIFLKCGDLEGQIRQIINATGRAERPLPFSRCLLCNEPLSDVSSTSVRERVPPYVFKNHSNFKMCPKCRKIFWSGTHRKSVMKKLEEFLPGSGLQEMNQN